MSSRREIRAWPVVRDSAIGVSVGNACRFVTLLLATSGSVAVTLLLGSFLPENACPFELLATSARDVESA